MGAIAKMGRFVVAFSSIYLLFILRFKFFFVASVCLAGLPSFLSPHFFSIWISHCCVHGLFSFRARMLLRPGCGRKPIDSTRTHENNSFEDRNAKMKMHKLLFLYYFCVFIIILLLRIAFYDWSIEPSWMAEWMYRGQVEYIVIPCIVRTTDGN